MLIKLERDARVLLPAGTVVEVSDQEGARLIAFGFGEEAPKKKTNKK